MGSGKTVPPRGWGSLLLGLLLAAALAGCSGPKDGYTIEGDDPKVVVFEYPDGGFEDNVFVPDIGYGGVLTRDPDTGCLYLGEAGPQPQYVRLIWPRGTRLAAEEGEIGVLVPADRVTVQHASPADQPGLGGDPYLIRVGEPLTFGGIRFSGAPYRPEEYFAWVEAAVEASGCGTRGDLLIVRNLSVHRSS